MARQIDHIMVLTTERERLVPLLIDTLQLPIVWPQPGDAWISTTGIALGDVNLELVPRQHATTTQLGNLAIQPVDLTTAPEQLKQRGLVPLEPYTHTNEAGVRRWTVVGFRHAFEGIAYFLIEYLAFDMNERRARFDQLLRQRQGGPLGLRRVREFRLAYAADNLPAARQGWQRLLGGVEADSNRFQFTAGPGIRLVPGIGPRASSLVIEVESLARATDAARSLRLLLGSSRDSVVLDPSRFGGLQLILVEQP